MIDDIDYQILDHLQSDARLSQATLAEQINVPLSTVRDRIKRLEQRGIIKGYVALVDAAALGKPITAFVRISVGTTPQNYIAAKAQFAQTCQNEPDILECHGVAGEDCYLLKVQAASPQGLEKLLERIRCQAQVIKSITNIVMMVVKESTKITP